MPPIQLDIAPGAILELLDLAGVAVFAASGALLAASKRQTLVTFIFFAVITGVGGGTARDLLVGAPVFWIEDNATLLICVAAALLVWLLPARLWKGRALLWFDAAGLAAYATYGAAKGLAFGVAPIPAMGMGVLTRRARRRAFHPHARRALCHRRRAFGGFDGGAAAARGSCHAGRRHCRGGRVPAESRRDPPRLEAPLLQPLKSP
jgi:hypothetical protein